MVLVAEHVVGWKKGQHMLCREITCHFFSPEGASKSPAVVPKQFVLALVKHSVK